MSTPPSTFLVGTDEAAAFWQLLDVEGPLARTALHPVHAAMAARRGAGTALAACFGDGVVLHVAERIEVHGGLEAGKPYTAQCDPLRVVPVAGAFLVDISTTVRAGGRLVVHAASTVRTRQWEGAVLGLEPPVGPPHVGPSGSPPSRMPWRPTSQYCATTARIADFAACTGDSQPIHLSLEAARAASLPDVVAHGMDTFAACFTAAASAAAPQRRDLRSLSLRFRRPIVAGSTVELQVAGVRGGIAVRALVHGRPVTRRGLAAMDDYRVSSAVTPEGRP